MSDQFLTFLVHMKVVAEVPAVAELSEADAKAEKKRLKAEKKAKKAAV
jgi:hypothetical protein